MEVITIINHKGGVGKTTTAQSLAAGLQKRGKEVLLIDLDAQTNLTFAVLKEIPEKSILNALEGKTNINECIYSIGNIDIVPASPSLVIADNYLQGQNKEFKIKEKIKDLKKTYDYIIIDTPPAINLLTINALAMSNRAIITAQADIYSLQGIKNLYENIKTVKEYCNNSLKIAGILLTRYSGRSILTRDMTTNMEKIANSIGTKVFNTKIRECIAIKEAQAVGVNIFDYAKNSNAAKDYNDFITELMED